MVWVHPKMTKTVSSTAGALVGAGSLKLPDEATKHKTKLECSNLHLR
jgi:hypothetical protein